MRRTVEFLLNSLIIHRNKFIVKRGINDETCAESYKNNVNITIGIVMAFYVVVIINYEFHGKLY